jgi:hypothetical protein
MVKGEKMPNYVAIQNGLVINILDAPTKDIAEEASGCLCVEYDDSFNPAIGDSWDGEQFQKQIID